MDEFKVFLASIDRRLARLCELQENTLAALEEVLSDEEDEDGENGEPTKTPTQEYPEPRRFKIDEFKL